MSENSASHSRQPIFYGCLAVLFILLPIPLQAQNTSSVFSPDVVKGRHAAEYRASYDLEKDFFSHRIHYQYGFNDSFRGRVILTQRKEDTEDFDFRYMRLEGLWQFLEHEKAGWDSALRFELQIADGDDPPSRFRVGWTSKVDFADDWQFRFNFLTGRQFGNEAGKGALLENRAQLTYKVADPIRLGVDYYGDMNDTEDVGNWKEQEHQIGPIIKFNLGGGWKGQAGPLFGISNAATDTELRIFLIKVF
jgi:hypothetical protein